MRAVIPFFGMIAMASWLGCATGNVGEPDPQDDTSRTSSLDHASPSETPTPTSTRAQPTTRTRAERVSRTGPIVVNAGEPRDPSAAEDSEDASWVAADRFDRCELGCDEGSLDDRATCRLNCLGFAMAAVDEPDDDAIPCVRPCLEQLNDCHFACGDRPPDGRRACRDYCEDDRSRCVIACAR